MRKYLYLSAVCVCMALCFVGCSKDDDEPGGKVGDTVLYGKYAGTELEVEGTKYLIMRQSDVLAVLG